MGRLQHVSIVLITILITSSLWLLAIVDDTVAYVKDQIAMSQELENLTFVHDKLKLETSIEELKLKKKMYRAQYDYLEAQGF